MVIFNTTVVGIIRGRVKSAITPCTAVEVELNRYLIENDYIISAPFKEIQHVFRLGENYSQPDIIAFRKKTGILETAIEVPLADVTNKAFDIAYPIMRKAALQTLLAVASKYSFPDQFLKDVLSASFPKNLYEETLEYEKKGLQLYYAWLAKQKE